MRACAAWCKQVLSLCTEWCTSFPVGHVLSNSSRPAKLYLAAIIGNGIKAIASKDVQVLEREGRAAVGVRLEGGCQDLKPTLHALHFCLLSVMPAHLGTPRTARVTAYRIPIASRTTCLSTGHTFADVLSPAVIHAQADTLTLAALQAVTLISTCSCSPSSLSDYKGQPKIVSARWQGVLRVHRASD